MYDYLEKVESADSNRNFPATAAEWATRAADPACDHSGMSYDS